MYIIYRYTQYIATSCNNNTVSVPSYTKHHSDQTSTLLILRVKIHAALFDSLNIQ